MYKLSCVGKKVRLQIISTNGSLRKWHITRLVRQLNSFNPIVNYASANLRLCFIACILLLIR